jgi:hypothetical protein
MGVVDTISATRWPEQGRYLGTDVLVCFHYDTSVTLRGRVVRDDAEAPGVMVIELEGGRYVLSTECMWTLP